jgi:hypothetical protein
MTTVIYLWRIPHRRVSQAIWHMATDRLSLKKNPGISFYKLIGTGTGETFTPRDADPTRWGLILTIDEDAIHSFDHSSLVASWRKIALSEVRYIAQPISAHGKWSSIEPFKVDTELAKSWGGKVLAITRARIKWRKNIRFWRAVPPVITSLRDNPGVESAIGIGEAPLGLQGTLSIWSSNAAVREFAYKGAAHSAVIRETHSERWYSEELFARFALIEVRGSVTEDK